MIVGLCTLDSHLECSLSVPSGKMCLPFWFNSLRKGFNVELAVCELCLLKYLIDAVEAVHLMLMLILIRDDGIANKHRSGPA